MKTRKKERQEKWKKKQKQEVERETRNRVVMVNATIMSEEEKKIDLKGKMRKG